MAPLRTESVHTFLGNFSTYGLCRVRCQLIYLHCKMIQWNMIAFYFKKAKEKKESKKILCIKILSFIRKVSQVESFDSFDYWL